MIVATPEPPLPTRAPDPPPRDPFDDIVVPAAGLTDLATRDVEVDVAPMTPPTPSPHVELLGYRHPVAGMSDSLSANDVAATRIVWRSDRAALLRDPDGHLHQLTP